MLMIFYSTKKQIFFFCSITPLLSSNVEVIKNKTDYSIKEFNKKYLNDSGNKNKELTKELIETLIGLVLGDLHVRRRNKHTCLCFKGSIKHSEYIKHLYSLFSDYCKSEPKIKE